MSHPKICVVGSSNYDLIAYTNRLPKKGETILGYDFKMGCGGKGANQAAASAKLSATVTMITKLGDDIFGKQTIENYKNLKINTDFISMTKDAPSGVAPIWVDKEGNNSIIVVSGANNLMTEKEIESASHIIDSSDLLICQNEIPLHVTQKALQIAKDAGVSTVFNPAPGPTTSLTANFYKNIDIICPNETEAEILTGVSVTSIDDAHKAAKILLQFGIKHVIITLGSEGSLIANNQNIKHIPSFKVKAQDTTGAGDCFIGSFSYFYASGLEIEDCVYRAQYIAAQSVQKSGTQSSYSSRENLPKELFNLTKKFTYNEVL